MQHAYVSITEIDRLNFSSCEGCQHSCCDGTRFVFAPLVLDDLEEVYRHFPIVFGRIFDEWRLLILFAEDDGFCRYHQEGTCTIYAERPPACKLYPLSPYYDDIVIDTSCHAVTTGNNGTLLASKEEINRAFYHERLNDFEAKRRATETYLKNLDDAFVSIGMIGGIGIHRYTGSRDDAYIQMHHQSLSLREAVDEIPS